MKSSSCIRISQLSLGLLRPRSAVASALLGDVLGRGNGWPVGQTSKDLGISLGISQENGYL